MSVIYFDRNYNLCERTGEEGSYVYTPLEPYQIRFANYPEIQDSVFWTASAPFYCKILGMERGTVLYNYPEWSSSGASMFHSPYNAGDIVTYSVGRDYQNGYFKKNAAMGTPTAIPPNDSTGWTKLCRLTETEKVIEIRTHIDFKIVCHYSTDSDWYNNFSFSNIISINKDYDGKWYNSDLRTYLNNHRSS